MVSSLWDSSPHCFCVFSVSSLRGRRLKGKGKGVLGSRETREAREEGAPLAFLSHLKLTFPSLSNAYHAGYSVFCEINKLTYYEMSTFKKINLHCMGINNGFFDYKIRIIPNQNEFGLQCEKNKKTKTKTFAPFICPFFFPNPLLNAFLAGILCQPFFYHTR